MAVFFKTRWVPNADGSDSTTVINSTNTAFVHTYQGDDATGDGTREKPFRTVNKASQKSGIGYIVFRGVVNEYFSTGLTIIGDDINQMVIASNYDYTVAYIYKATLDIIPSNIGGYDRGLMSSVIVNGSNGTSLAKTKSSNSLIKTSIYNSSSGYSSFFQTTFNELQYNGATIAKNLLVAKSLKIAVFNIDIYHVPFSYLVTNTLCVFTYNTTVLNVTFTSDSKANVQLLRNALVIAGMPQATADLLFTKDSFGNETCQIVWEQRNGGTLPNIFNAYNADGSVADFTLNPDPNNVALWASDIGGYVGFSKPAFSLLNPTSNQFSAPINVNADGSDDIAAGTLLVVNTDNSLNFSITSAQLWNRMKGNSTLFIPQGRKFNCLGSMSQDGSPFGYYIGKYQNLMGSVQLQPTDTLQANTWYKVSNASGSSVTNAILYNGVQYLPDYFFLTNSTVLNYSLLNSGTGSYVTQLLASPLQSIEIIPYDNLTTPSVSFPKFSAPLMGNCMVLFYKAGNTYGKTAGAPVLFGDTQVAAMTDKIAYYATWAVSNADWEFEVLSQDTTNYTYSIPILQYLRLEVNGHYNQTYDQ